MRKSQNTPDNNTITNSIAKPTTKSLTNGIDESRIAFLRNDGSASANSVNMAQQQLQGARLTAKLTHSVGRRAMTVDSTPVNIYVWPFTMGDNGWWFGVERKITAKPGAYTSVHLSLNASSIVFSATIDGYNQIFTSTAPVEGQTLAPPLQLTTDMEQHWLPHISADGSKVVFTKSDPLSDGDAVCIIDNAAGATENCLDFSSTLPVLKGAYMWHASWSPQGKIAFEAWEGPLKSDDIFIVNADGSGLTQITNNAGTKSYDECPSVFPNDENWIAVDTWNDETQHYEVGDINIKTKERFTFSGDPNTDAWDPLATLYSPVWVSRQHTDQSLELYIMTFDPMRMTTNTYADVFENSPK